MIKEKLFQYCVEYVEARLSTIEKTIQSHQRSLASETKSSAGDKHETGRAMLQLEMEKAGQQLASVQQMKETLARIDLLKTSERVHLGTLVSTNLGDYFLAVSVGQVVIDKTSYFVISPSAPVGKILLGKQAGDSLVWNGRKIEIHHIS